MLDREASPVRHLSEAIHMFRTEFVMGFSCVNESCQRLKVPVTDQTQNNTKFVLLL